MPEKNRHAKPPRLERAALGLAALLFFPSRRLPAELSGPPITGNNYLVDVSRGVALGPNRQVAMGGADTALAEGAASLADNPAAAAFRPPPLSGTWNWDFTLGSFVTTGSDLDNNGSLSSSYEKNQITNVGLLCQWGTWGVGYFGVAQRYDIKGPAVTNRLEFGSQYVAVGRSFRQRQWTAGLGIRPVSLNVTPYGTSEKILKLNGNSVGLGVLWNPRRGPFRLGAAYTGRTTTNQPLGDGNGGPRLVDGLIAPREVVLPAAASLGACYTGKGPARWGAKPFVLSGDVRLLGCVRDAVGVESFLEQKVQRSGERTSVGFHLGAEVELLADRLRLRGGTYNEPSRFRGVSARQHGTGGMECRLFKMRFFGERHLSLSYAFDAARSYTNQSLSVGLWRAWKNPETAFTSPRPPSP